MKKKFIFLIILISFFGCSDDQLTGGNELFFDEKEAIIESNWNIQKYTVKHGTHNPDEVVPPSQEEEISSGNKLVGEINFNSDSTIYLSNASDEFIFRGLNEMLWSYENSFIRFKHSTRGFGYNVQWFGNEHMRWYIQGVGIESGIKVVTIIELNAI